MQTRHLTLRDFIETILQDGIVLVDWWADWCGPCRVFEPIFEAAAERHPDVVFGKVDTDANPDLAAAFRIAAIPTLMVFRDGVLVFAEPGMLSADALDELVATVRELDMDEVRREIDAAAPPSAP